MKEVFRPTEKSELQALFGYVGPYDLVAVYYDSESDEWVLDDGDNISQMPKWRTLASFIETNRDKLIGFDLGGEGRKATHWLVIDSYGTAEVGTATECLDRVTQRKCIICDKSFLAERGYYLPEWLEGKQSMACRADHRNRRYNNNGMKDELEEVKQLEDLDVYSDT